MSWVWQPGGVSWSRVWGGNLGFFSYYFVLELIEENTIQPWSSVWTFIKCSESTAFRVLQVQDDLCQSFTMASLSLTVSKIKQKQMRKSTSSRIKIFEQREKLKLATSSPQRPNPPTGLSRGTGSGNWRPFVRLQSSRLHHPCAPHPFIIKDPVSFHIY